MTIVPQVYIFSPWRFLAQSPPDSHSDCCPTFEFPLVAAKCLHVLCRRPYDHSTSNDIFFLVRDFWLVLTEILTPTVAPAHIQGLPFCSNLYLNVCISQTNYIGSFRSDIFGSAMSRTSLYILMISVIIQIHVGLIIHTLYSRYDISDFITVQLLAVLPLLV